MSKIEIISQAKKIFVLRNSKTKLYGLVYDFYGENRTLQPIEFHWIEISKYSEGLLKVITTRNVKKEYLHDVGYYDELGNLSLSYTNLDYEAYHYSDFSDGLARIMKPKFFGVAHNWVYIDKLGNTVLKYNADGYGFSGGYAGMGIFSEGLAAVQPPADPSLSGYIERKYSPWGFMNKQGKMVIPATYFSAGDFHEGLCSVNTGNENGILRIGFINRENKLVIPLEYDWLIDHGRKLPDRLPMPQFKNGLAIVVKNNKYGVINTKNEIVISFNYSRLYEMEKEYPHLFKE